MSDSNDPLRYFLISWNSRYYPHSKAEEDAKHAAMLATEHLCHEHVLANMQFTGTISGIRHSGAPSA
ncbi:MAG: hypothetical protein ACYDGY_10150 [Acidimicrobiales bacterium]